jgi:chitin disaccharide deacetylase
MAVPKRLIVNADDLALHPCVNQAIVKAHREGIVTSTTILAGGSAFFDAVAGVKSCPELGVGVHLCLVDQKPVLDPAKIPSLVDKDGKFPDSYGAFLRGLVLQRFRMSDVRRELEAQITRVLDQGLKVTHLDSHQHLHLLPGISSVVAELGIKMGLRRIRVPSEIVIRGCESPSILRRLQGQIVLGLARKRRREFLRRGLTSPDHFAGFGRGGNFNADNWRALIPQLREGVTEVMVHPGADNSALQSATHWNYHWEQELAALTDPNLKQLIQDHGIQLVNYRDLD